MQDISKQPTKSSSGSQTTSSAASSGGSPLRERLRGMSYGEAVQCLAPVQRRGDPDAVHAAAKKGTAGPGGAMPHLAAIQRSFGKHDVSGVKAHTGGRAGEACDAMGAEAYASGDNIAFKGAPDLHTAAHEAAHIVQQRQGVSLSQGVGKSGDAYEKQADAIADRVVQGKSAEDLLGGTKSGEAGEAVQKKEAAAAENVADTSEKADETTKVVDEMAAESEGNETEAEGEADDGLFWEALGEVMGASSDEAVQLKEAAGKPVQLKGRTAAQRAAAIKHTRAKLGPHLKKISARYNSMLKLVSVLSAQEKLLRELVYDAIEAAKQKEKVTAWSHAAANTLMGLGSCLQMAGSVPSIDKAIAKKPVEPAHWTKIVTEIKMTMPRAAGDVAQANGFSMPPEAAAMLSIAGDLPTLAMAPTPVNFAFSATKVIATIAMAHNDKQVDSLWAKVPQIQQQYYAVRGQWNVVKRQTDAIGAKLRQLANFK